MLEIFSQRLMAPWWNLVSILETHAWKSINFYYDYMVNHADRTFFIVPCLYQQGIDGNSKIFASFIQLTKSSIRISFLSKNKVKKDQKTFQNDTENHNQKQTNTLRIDF